MSENRSERHDYDVLREAEQVAAEQAERVGMPRDTFYAFEALYTARRALRLATVYPKATTAVDGWIAQVHGISREYHLDRTFLPKCWRVLDHDSPAARDCTTVQAGDILQCRRDQGYTRWARRVTDKFLRVTAITDAGLFAILLKEEEVAAIYHGEVR